MKKTFGIMGTGLLLASNVLMSFSNVSFAVSCGDRTSEEIEVEGCYVLKHYYHNYNCESHYERSDLLSYKCDTKGGIVDLRDAPLEDGQYIIAIGEDAFSGTNVTKVIMPSTVESVGNGAFCNAEKVGTGCGNGIIEQGEECDDGNEIFMFGVDDSYMCDNECKRVPVPVCGNRIWEQGENCNNCKVDVEADGGNCTKSVGEEIDVKFLDENQDLENQDLDQEDLEYKGEYRQISRDGSSSEDLVEVADFVVVDFPDGMNDEFNIEDLDYACAKLQEYTISFKTEDGKELGTGETFNQRIEPLDIPEAPEKEGFIGIWYLGNEIFDFDSQITGNITLVYKYEKGGIEYDEENGWIKVSLGDQEIIIKDKNQGAEKSVSEVDTGDPSDFINAIGIYYLWGNNTGLNLKENLGDDGLVNLDEVILPEGFDHGYLGMEGGDDWTMGSNDTPCNVDSGEYLPSPDDWKNLMQIWGKLNGYELNHDNMGYYFDDRNMYFDPVERMDPIEIHHLTYTSEVNGESNPGNVQYPSAIEEFLNDLYIGFLPSSLYVENGGVDFSHDSILFPSSLNNGNIGYLAINGLYLLDVSTLNNGFVNSLATPVRCFVKPQFEVSFEVNGGTDVVTQKIFSGDNAVEPEVQKENAEFLGWFTEDGAKFIFDTPITSDIKLHAEWQENKPNNESSSNSGNGYSGGGGGGSSSSSVKNSDKSDDSSKDKVSPASEVKENSTSEKKVDKEQQNNLVDDNQKQTEKTETVVTHKVSYVPDTTLPEKEQAYDFAHTYGITTKTSVESAEMDKPLTRIQMAKMLSNYAMNVMGRQPDVSEGTVKFRDVTNDMDKSYDNGVTLSYQLGIMGQNMPNHKFRPNDIVTRAEFITALSRLLYSTSDGEYRSTSRYYVHHMEKLKNEGIITNDNPNMTEKRGYVMLMLLRSVK